MYMMGLQQAMWMPRAEELVQLRKSSKQGSEATSPRPDAVLHGGKGATLI